MTHQDPPSPGQHAPFGTPHSPLWEHDESEDEPFIEIVGSLNIDLVTRTKRMPRAGETLQAQSFTAGFGGKGANQAVACARLVRDKQGGLARNGTIVHMVGAVGTGGGSGVDIGAQSYLDHLNKEGIETGHVLVKDDVPTGTAVIVVEEETGENRILITPGANGAINSGELQLDNFPVGVVMFQLEIPIEIILECMRHYKNKRKIIILNAAPAMDLPDEIYEGVHSLHVNEVEAAMLTDIPEDEIEAHLPEVAEFFRRRGVQNIVVTMGSRGVYWRDKNRRDGRIPAHKCEVMDTTAAGDTFAGAYAVWLALHGPDNIETACQFANLAAALSVQRIGAQASMPFLSEVEEMSGTVDVPGEQIVNRGYEPGSEEEARALARQEQSYARRRRRGKAGTFQ